MAVVPFTTVPLAGDVAAALTAIPKAAGVGQILGLECRSLLIGRPASLRRWAASHLGQAKPARPGARPRTDLRPVAAAVSYAETGSPFEQRLVFERLMASHVSAPERRDLRPPVYLHLDPGERFPRVTLRSDASEHSFGPFRDRRVAGSAVRALHRLFPLRPCDYGFEPDPALPLGLACIYAQVRTCAAPCLARVSEEAYRALAREAASLLAQDGPRPPEAAEWLPTWVSQAASLGLVVETRKQDVVLYPVRAGAVVEEAALTASADDLVSAVAHLAWPLPEDGRDDRLWLSAWLHAPRKRGGYLVVHDPEERDVLTERIRSLV